MPDEIAPRDDNYEPVITGTSSVNGEDVLNIVDHGKLRKKRLPIIPVSSNKEENSKPKKDLYDFVSENVEISFSVINFG